MAHTPANKADKNPRANISQQAAALRRDAEMLSAQAIAIHTQAARISNLSGGGGRVEEQAPTDVLSAHLAQFSSSLRDLEGVLRTLTTAAERMAESVR
jgi:chromosomal replication initiation ATPase DnaA